MAIGNGCHLGFSASGQSGICVHPSLHLERRLLVVLNGFVWKCGIAAINGHWIGNMMINRQLLVQANTTRFYFPSLTGQDNPEWWAYCHHRVFLPALAQRQQPVRCLEAPIPSPHFWYNGTTSRVYVFFAGGFDNVENYILSLKTIDVSFSFGW